MKDKNSLKELIMTIRGITQIITFSLFLSSCTYTNKECVPFYIGKFKIDTNLISNPKCMTYVKQYQWDTVNLISNSDGKYYFVTKDPMLKKCEGKWWTTSNDTEGNCFGHVKQKNMGTEFITMPFDIWIKIEGESYSLPFRRVDSLNQEVSNKATTAIHYCVTR